MTNENQGDNKPNADNKAPEVKPFPQEQAKEPQDPELAKWMADTKDLPNAYKRVKGAESEVEKYRSQLEEKESQFNQYQQQVAQELKEVITKNPTVAEAFGIKLPEKPKKGKEPQYNPDDVARQVQAQVEVSNFRERNGQYITDDNDWDAIQDIAVGFLGKKDTDGKPYSVQTALRDALLIRHKDLIGNKAVSSYLTSQAKRASASESGSTSSTSSDELEPKYQATAEAMGMTLTPEVKQHILANRKKREAT